MKSILTNSQMGSMLFLLIILVFGIYLAPLLKKLEGFKSQDLATPGTYPLSVDKPMLNTYPLIGGNNVSNDDYSEIWWHYPIFQLGSYKQLTNNLRYRNNPDDGTCSTADFCGALYHSKKNKTNEVHVLPPAKEGPGARVGYYRSEPNLLYFSIPTNENILY
jgi:hypothetical protein